MPVFIEIDNNIGNFTTMSIAKSGSTRSDPGLSASVIEQATRTAAYEQVP